MQTVQKAKQIPENSIITKNFTEIDYQDTYLISKKTDSTIDRITVGLFKGPKWADNLMKLRDSIVRLFGLKTGKKKETSTEEHISVGSKVEFFTVVDRNENEIVMAENDKHLNFKTSVMIDRNEVDTIIYLSTIVKFNNIFGRLYFIPVKPFHRLIIKSILRKFAKEKHKSYSYQSPCSDSANSNR